MEEMVKMNRRGEIEEPTPKEEKPQRMPTRKEMRATMLPKIGDTIGSGKVVYVNNGKFRFTAEAAVLPEVGAKFIDVGRIYEVSWLDHTKKRFSAVFKGFEENPIKEDAPVEIEEDLVKVI